MARGKQVKQKNFWNREYARGGDHLALSMNPSEDLIKFCRFVERTEGKGVFNASTSVVDFGCGNGRNLIYLAETYGSPGFGMDTSHEAIAHARSEVRKRKLPVTVTVQSMTTPTHIADESVTLALDMMASHVLTATDRQKLLAEIARIVAPGGWFFFKTFLRDGDRNAERMLKEAPGNEEGSYLHPHIGTEEHVFSKSEIQELLDPYFVIHKIVASHKHLRNGRAWKRRTVSVYAQRS